MGITVNTSPQQITASVGETQIDVTVSGGIGPSGAVGGGYTLPTATSSVLGGVKIGSGVTITDGVISVSTSYAAASHTHAISDITDLASTLSGIDTAISGKAAASHTHDSLTGQNSSLLCDDNIIAIYADGIYLNGGPIYPYQLGSTAGLILKTGASGVFETLAQGTAGQVLVVNAGATAPEWKTLAAADVGASALGHAHSASDVTSGVFDVARIPQFDVRADTVSSTSYIGRAVSGSATSASVWKIRKTVYSSAGAVSSTTTATNVKWDDRLTASYS